MSLLLLELNVAMAKGKGELNKYMPIIAVTHQRLPVCPNPSDPVHVTEDAFTTPLLGRQKSSRESQLWSHHHHHHRRPIDGEDEMENLLFCGCYRTKFNGTPPSSFAAF